jgi:hypothetical protein
MVTLYKQIDALIAAADAIALPIPADATAPNSLFVQYWLYRVFDRYVLEGANLENELKQAETLATGYQACVAAVPPASSSSTEEVNRYYQRLDDCAFKLDPGLKPLFRAG